MASNMLSRGYETTQDRDGNLYIRPPGAEYLVQPDILIPALQVPGLDPEVKKALLDQLDAWVKLAKFAKSLSIGLAIGSAILALFMLSAMTWGDLFTGSSLWEFGVILFALAVFIASPLAIFVLGRPLKGVDEWSPTLSTTTRDPHQPDT